MPCPCACCCVCQEDEREANFEALVACMFCDKVGCGRLMNFTKCPAKTHAKSKAKKSKGASRRIPRTTHQPHPMPPPTPQPKRRSVPAPSARPPVHKALPSGVGEASLLHAAARQPLLPALAPHRLHTPRRRVCQLAASASALARVPSVCWRRPASAASGWVTHRWSRPHLCRRRRRRQRWCRRRRCLLHPANRCNPRCLTCRGRSSCLETRWWQPPTSTCAAAAVWCACSVCRVSCARCSLAGRDAGFRPHTHHQLTLTPWPPPSLCFKPLWPTVRPWRPPARPIWTCRCTRRWPAHSTAAAESRRSQPLRRRTIRWLPTTHWQRTIRWQA